MKKPSQNEHMQSPYFFDDRPEIRDLLRNEESFYQYPKQNDDEKQTPTLKQAELGINNHR